MTSEDTDFWTLSIENSEISISYFFCQISLPHTFDPSLIFHPQKRPLLAVVADGCGLDSDVIGVHWWRHACTRLRRCMTSDMVILSARAAARVPLFKLPINIIALKIILKHHNKKYLTYLLAHYWKNFLILSLGRKTFPTDEMGSMYILVCKKTSLYTCTESFRKSRKIVKITIEKFP